MHELSGLYIYKEYLKDIIAEKAMEKAKWGRLQSEEKADVLG